MCDLNKLVAERQRALDALEDRKKEIRTRLYHIQNEQEKFNMEYQELYWELMGLPAKQAAAERDLLEVLARI